MGFPIRGEGIHHRFAIGSDADGHHRQFGALRKISDPRKGPPKLLWAAVRLSVAHQDQPGLVVGDSILLVLLLAFLQHEHRIVFHFRPLGLHDQVREALGHHDMRAVHRHRVDRIVFQIDIQGDVPRQDGVICLGLLIYVGEDRKQIPALELLVMARTEIDAVLHQSQTQDAGEQKRCIEYRDVDRSRRIEEFDGQ